MSQHRFSGFSNPIDLLRFKRESRRLLRAGFLFAILFHFALVLLMPPRERPKAVFLPRQPDRIIHATLIERPVESALPFMAGRRLFVPRSLRPQGLTRSGPSLHGMSGFTGKTLPSPLTDRPYAFRSEPVPSPEWEAKTDTAYVLPDEIASGERVERIIPGEISLQDELVAPEDFSDTQAARTRGMVFYNPNRKMGVRGVIPIPCIYTASQPAKNLSPGIDGLAEGIRQLTDITVANRRNVYLQQNTVFEYPFVYIACGEQWEYLPGEAKKMGQYLRSGGFVVLEDLTPWEEHSPGEASLRQFIRDAMGSGFRFEPIPNDHPLYHSYFDFDDGPPIGVELKTLDGATSMSRPKGLEGIWMNGRLAVVFSHKGYGALWLRRGSNEPPIKMGVNLLVYALLQEGGKAVKRQDGALDPGTMSRRNTRGEGRSPSSGSPGGGRRGR